MPGFRFERVLPRLLECQVKTRLSTKFYLLYFNPHIIGLKNITVLEISIHRANGQFKFVQWPCVFIYETASPRSRTCLPRALVLICLMNNFPLPNFSTFFIPQVSLSWNCIEAVIVLQTTRINACIRQVNGSVLWRMKLIPIVYISIRVWPFPVRLV